MITVHQTESPINEELESLCRQLAVFEFPQCGMLHERIQRVAGREEPIRDSSAEHGYLRSEYCSGITRRKRLGCAHTMARNDFELILNALAGPLFDDQQVSRWKKTLQDLDQSIIEVDWKKSDAELTHAKQFDALSLGPGDNGTIRQQIEKTTDQIQDLVDTHSEYVLQLRELRDEVLTAVRSAQSAQRQKC